MIVLLFYALPIQAAEVAGKNLTITLDQTNPSTPKVLSLYLENNNPNRYMIVLPSGFITVKEENATGTILYEGRVNNIKKIFVGGITPPAHHPNFEIIRDNPLTINFPYFDDAKWLKIYNESGALLLTIDLSLYGIGPTPTPEPRFIGCNKCGYCTGKKPPQDLDKCMACLYPDFVGNPEGTLAIDPKNNQPVKPRTGAYYSQLGCIDVGIAGFRDAGAAGGVTNAILTRLIFPITGVLSLLALIYGAFLLITARGDADQINRGKRWIYGALIGVGFTFIAIFIIRLIAGDILRIPGFDI